MMSIHKPKDFCWTHNQNPDTVTKLLIATKYIRIIGDENVTAGQLVTDKMINIGNLVCVPAASWSETREHNTFNFSQK